MSDYENFLFYLWVHNFAISLKKNTELSCLWLILSHFFIYKNLENFLSHSLFYFFVGICDIYLVHSVLKFDFIV